MMHNHDTWEVYAASSVLMQRRLSRLIIMRVQQP